MSTCQHLYKTGDNLGLTCQGCGDVFPFDSGAYARLLKRKQQKPLETKDIGFWYLVPVRITFHYPSDGEDSFIDTMLDIPMTDPLIKQMKEATADPYATEEAALEAGLDALLVKIKHRLDRRCPPARREKRNITVKITGPIGYSKKPIH
jgi:hypothetical protein